MPAPDGLELSRPVALVEGYALADREFHLLRRLVQEHTGIALGPHKREMLRARLSRRLRALRLPGFPEYCRLLQGPESAAAELPQFVNAVTTNVTGFFREAHHFRHMTEVWLPEVRDRAANDGQRRLRIWSAGCSTGEEPYSIALTLLDHLGAALPRWDVRILASDIDTDALARAAAGVYPAERAAGVPPSLLPRGFLRGTGDWAGKLRVRPEVQEMVAFRHINLMDEPWPIRTRFDAIFCRNVLIYFDRPSQRRLLDGLFAFLRPDGLLFLGHSESLHGLLTGMKHIRNTIYQRQEPMPAR